MLTYDVLFNAFCLIAGSVLTYLHSAIPLAEPSSIAGKYAFTELDWEEEPSFPPPSDEEPTQLRTSSMEANKKPSPHKKLSFLIDLSADSLQKIRKNPLFGGRRTRQIEKAAKAPRSLPKAAPKTRQSPARKPERINMRESIIGVVLEKSQRIECELEGEELSDREQVSQYQRLLSQVQFLPKVDVPLPAPQPMPTTNPFALSNIAFARQSPLQAQTAWSGSQYPPPAPQPLFALPAPQPAPALPLQPSPAPGPSALAESTVEFQASLPMPEPALCSPQKASRQRKGMLYTAQDLGQPEDTDFMPQAQRNKILSTEQIPNSTSINSNTFEQQRQCRI